MKKTVLLIMIVGFLNLSCSGDNSPAMEHPHPASHYEVSQEQTAFLDSLQRRSFLYFINEINSVNGLVKDRSTGNSPASIAAVGFALPVWAIGAEREWITRDRARQLTLNCLRFFWNSSHGPDTLVTGYKGFYYHFIDMQSGLRVWKCELSTIDTAWLIAGVRFARQYYSENSAEEAEIRSLADSLTSRLDWDFFSRPDSVRHPGSVSMGWHPEQGYGPVGWVGYNEGLYLYILAAGTGYAAAGPAYKQWLSHYKWGEPYPGQAHVLFPPMFGHQYSHMFVDFRGLADSYMREKGIDYFENSRRAVYTQRFYAMENPQDWSGYDSLTWGLTACDGPGPKYNFDDHQFKTYSARGSSGTDMVHNDDGTIAPTAAGGSVVFAPEIVIPTLFTMYQRYHQKGLWGPYGFYDAFNPTLNWTDPDYLGIDQGPIVIMIENYRSEMVWKYAMRDPVIQRGLNVLGFQTVKAD